MLGIFGYIFNEFYDREIERASEGEREGQKGNKMFKFKEGKNRLHWMKFSYIIASAPNPFELPETLEYSKSNKLMDD